MPKRLGRSVLAVGSQRAATPPSPPPPTSCFPLPSSKPSRWSARVPAATLRLFNKKGAGNMEQHLRVGQIVRAGAGKALVYEVVEVLGEGRATRGHSRYVLGRRGEGSGKPDLPKRYLRSASRGVERSPEGTAAPCLLPALLEPIEIELPPGMTRCPGEAMGKVKFKQIKDFPPSRRIRTPRPRK